MQNNMFKKLSFVIRYVADRFKSHEICDEASDNPFVFDSVSDWCQTQEMCGKIFSGGLFN